MCSLVSSLPLEPAIVARGHMKDVHANQSSRVKRIVCEQFAGSLMHVLFSLENFVAFNACLNAHLGVRLSVPCSLEKSFIVSNLIVQKGQVTYVDKCFAVSDYVPEHGTCLKTFVSPVFFGGFFLHRKFVACVTASSACTLMFKHLEQLKTSALVQIKSTGNSQF